MAVNPKTEIIRHNIIYRDRAYYSAMPAVAAYQDKYICLFRRAPSGKKTHLHAESHLFLMISDKIDNWEKSKEFYFKEKNALQDGNIFISSKGKICIYSFSWKKHKLKPKNNTWRLLYNHNAYWQCCGVSLYLADSLHTNINKYKKYTIINSDFDNTLAVRGQITELNNGDWLLPVYGIKNQGEQSRVIIYRSKNQGISFLPIADFHAPEFTTPYYEPGLYRNKNTITCFIRTHKYLHLFSSHNNGKTWRGPIISDIIGHPFNIINLPDNKILLTYSRRNKPFGIYAIISNNDGSDIKEKNKIIVRSCDSPNHGYPYSLYENGKIYTFYYLSNGRGPTHIAQTVWNPV